MRMLYLLPSFKTLGLCVAIVTSSTVLSGCGGGGGGVSAPASGQVRIACVGDSITAGDHTANRSKDSYPAVIRSWLSNGYYVQNFGVGGTTILTTGVSGYQQTKTYNRALELKPNIVVVALGTNDVSVAYDATTKARFQSDYKTLIGAFKAANPSVRIYPCLPPPRYVSKNDILSNDILPLIRNVAQDEGLQVIDLNTPLSNHPELFVDGIHPNAQGARIIAGLVYRALTGQQSPA